MRLTAPTFDSNSMIDPETFIQRLRESGFGMFSGVPCSYLTPLINTVIDSSGIHYIGAANEGDAVAMACGAQLGGTGGVVMFQNSGLGNAINPLTSLTNVFEIPLLVIATWRGEPDGKPDEPQHRQMGQITPELFQLMDIPYEILPDEEDAVAQAVERAVQVMRTSGRCYGLLVRHGTVSPRELQSRADTTQQFCPDWKAAGAANTNRFEQDDVLDTIQRAANETDVILATTGFTGRALYALADRPNQLYMVGSMGCVSSLGLGLATVQSQRRVIVLDGDGAALMRMGAFATIGAHRPPNLLHVVLDNAAHDSTGTQATVSPHIDFPSIALACGYPQAVRIEDLSHLKNELNNSAGGLKLLHVRTKPRANRKLPRPTVTPAEVARRLADWMGVEPWTTTLDAVF